MYLPSQRDRVECRGDVSAVTQGQSRVQRRCISQRDRVECRGDVPASAIAVGLVAFKMLKGDVSAVQGGVDNHIISTCTEMYLLVLCSPKVRAALLRGEMYLLWDLALQWRLRFHWDAGGRKGSSDFWDSTLQGKVEISLGCRW
jgi:hypothetical protein